MKKVLVLAILLPLCLWAADFWQSKPYTQWSEKDVHKMVTGSPWAKEVTITLGSGGGGGNQGKSGRSRQPGSMGEINSSNPGGGGGAGGAGGPGIGGGVPDSGSGRYAGQSSDPGGGPGAGAPTLTLVVRWQSSLAIREALVRGKYGNEAATAPEAKKMLDENNANYIVSIAGLPKMALRGSPEEMKKAMLEAATLSVKGKEPIKAADFMEETGGRTADAYFAFPKSTPLTEDDKEVEFAVKIGDFHIKQKFRLKDMMLNGKLDL